MTMPSARDADETVSLQLRIPERLRQDLAAAARANGRSLNSELAQRLTTSLHNLDLTTAERDREWIEQERERGKDELRAEVSKRLADLQAQAVEAERRVRASWDAERERERAERTRLVEMLERQARTEAQVEVLSNQVQDFKKHQENIEAIPVILSAIEELESGLDIVSSIAVDSAGDTLGGFSLSEFNTWMEKKRHDAYVAYVATLPVVTADQAQTIKALLNEIRYKGESEEKSEERFLAEVAAPRIEDIRGFERVMKLLGEQSYRLEADYQPQIVKALLNEAGSGGREAFLAVLPEGLRSRLGFE